MASTTAVTRAQFEMRLRVTVPGTDEPVEFKCVGLSANFSLNRIPFATATIAVGRQVVTGDVANVHSQLAALQSMVRAEVVLTPSGQWSVSENGYNETKWTDAGEQVVFDGYITGLGVRRSRGSLRVSVQLIHWLSDLAFSSIFSNQSHPGNPANLTFNAVYQAQLSGTASSNPAFIGAHRHFNELNEGTVLADLWRALANMFCKISEEDLIQIGPPGQCAGVANARNDFSLDALARMQGSHTCAERGADRHIPLTFSDLGTQGNLLAAAARQFIGQQMAQAWWATTLWDKLVHDLGPKFMFHIVPLVQTALVTPFVPGLRSTYQKVITAADTAQIYLTSHVKRPMRAVGVFAGREARTVPSEPVPVDIAGLSGIGGCYMPNKDRRGVVQLRRAPSWITSVPDFATTSATTTRGGRIQMLPTGSATTPIAPVGPGAEGTRATNSVQTSDVYGRLARYIYVNEALRGRSGMLMGKFRLDIAPGSTVKIEQTEPFLAETDLSPTVIASVMAVTLGLDAESGKAMTVFQLAHVRSESENESDETSVDSHPLYVNQVYLGAPLVEEYLFPSSNEEDDNASLET